eukprot:gene9014-11035_t
MNHSNVVRYPEGTYDFGSSPSPPNLYSPMYRPPPPPMYSMHYGSRYMDTHSAAIAEDEANQDKIQSALYEQQRKIQFLEEEISRKRDTIEGLQSQLSKYEQEKMAEKKKQSRYWTPDEHSRFLEALSKYGHKDVKSISQYVATRNPTQVRTHAQKYFLRIDRERQRKIENKDSSDKEDRDDWRSDDHYQDEGSPLYVSCTNSPTSHHPANPFPSPTSTVPSISPNILKRKRETVTITASQAKSANLYRDAVLETLPTSWTGQDYDLFAKGLIAHIDQDDTHTLFKMIKEEFLPQHSLESIESAYHAFHRIVVQKSKEPLISPNNINGSGVPQTVPPNNNQNPNNPNSYQNYNPNNGSPNNSDSSSPNYSTRSPTNIGKKRPPPVNVPRSEYPVTPLTPGGSSPSYVQGYSSTNMQSPMGMIHNSPSLSLHPPSPSLSSPSMRWPNPLHYEYRRLEPHNHHIPMSPNHGYIPLHGPHPHTPYESPISDDSPGSGHPASNWVPNYTPVDSPSSWAAMNQTISAFSNASITNNNAHLQSVSSHD